MPSRLTFGRMVAATVLTVFVIPPFHVLLAQVFRFRRTYQIKKAYAELEQIKFMLKQAKTAIPIAEVLRRMGISERTFYR